MGIRTKISNLICLEISCSGRMNLLRLLSTFYNHHFLPTRSRNNIILRLISTNQPCVPLKGVGCFRRISRISWNRIQGNFRLWLAETNLRGPMAHELYLSKYEFLNQKCVRLFVFHIVTTQINEILFKSVVSKFVNSKAYFIEDILSDFYCKYDMTHIVCCIW